MANEAGIDLTQLLDHVVGQRDHPQLAGGTQIQNVRGGHHGVPAHGQGLAILDQLAVLGDGAVALRPEIVQLHAVGAQQPLPPLGEARVPARREGHGLPLQVGELPHVGILGDHELPDVGIIVGHEEWLVCLLALPGVRPGAGIGEHGGHGPAEVRLVIAHLLHIDQRGPGLHLHVHLGEALLDHLRRGGGHGRPGAARGTGRKDEVNLLRLRREGQEQGQGQSENDPASRPHRWKPPFELPPHLRIAPSPSPLPPLPHGGRGKR